jgi:phage terminase large subunit-like protein
LREEAYLSYRDYNPDRVLIEKKASGHSLLQELRRKDVPITAVKVKDSKIARAHAASIVLEQGCVYYMDRPWVEEVISQCAEFPNGQFDDLTDCCTAAWNWLRRTFWLQLGDEEDEDPDSLIQQHKRHWYLTKKAA